MEGQCPRSAAVSELHVPAVLVDEHESDRTCAAAMYDVELPAHVIVEEESATNTALALGESGHVQQQSSDDELRFVKAEVERLKAEIEKLKGHAAIEAAQSSQEMEAEARSTSVKDGNSAPSPRSIVLQATGITVARVSGFACRLCCCLFIRLTSSCVQCSI
jgi:hypothetical protein